MTADTLKTCADLMHRRPEAEFFSYSVASKECVLSMDCDTQVSCEDCFYGDKTCVVAESMRSH